MINRTLLNKKNSDGLTLVHLAAKNHQYSHLLLLKKLKARFKSRTKNGETALLLVCKHMPRSKIYTPEEIKIIDLLVKKSWGINIPDNNGYSPLHYASRNCSARVIEKLIRLGANVNCQKNNLKLSPLHCAVLSCRLDIVDTLIRHDANVNPVAIDGLTPLHFAVISSTLRIVKYLLDLGAKINYRESLCLFTPMHLALLQKRKDMFNILSENGANVNITSKSGVTCLHLASIIGDVDIVDKLLQLGADVNCRENNLLITPLHVVLSRGQGLKIILDEDCLLFKFLRLPCVNTCIEDYNGVFFRLLENRADVKLVSKDGMNALHFSLAAKTVDTDVIKILLDSKIDVNAVESNWQLTPLLIASREGLDNAIAMLLKIGANVNATTRNGKNSLHFAIKSCKDSLNIVKLFLKYHANVNCREFKYHFTPLHTAAGCKKRGDVIRELINAGADVKALTKDGRNALHLAAELGDVENVKVLIECAVDPNFMEMILQYTPLHLAVINDRLKVIEEIIKGGADVNAKDSSGKTVLHLATCYEDKMMEILVNYGAYVEVQDNTGRMPLHYAIQHNNESALMILMKSGVNINDTLLCKEFDVDGVMERSFVKKFVVRHLIELKTIGFPIAKVYKKLITLDELQSVYYKNCVNEVIMLRMHMLDDKMSLYDFLHADPDDRFAYAKSVLSSEFDTKFRIYGNLVKRCCTEAIDRKIIVGPAILALKLLMKLEIPDSCVKKIFLYLKSWHLKAIVVAAEDEKNFKDLFKAKVCCVQ